MFSLFLHDLKNGELIWSNWIHCGVLLCQELFISGVFDHLSQLCSANNTPDRSSNPCDLDDANGKSIAHYDQLFMEYCTSKVWMTGI